MNRQIYRQQPRHFDGYRRTNFCPDIRTNQIVYRLTPVGIGKLTTFREKVQIVIDENKLILQNTVNPLFEFAITMFALYRAITFGFNAAKISKKIVEELTLQLKNKKKYEQIHNRIEDLVRKVCRKQVENQFRGKPRLQKLKLYEARLDNEVEETLIQAKLFNMSLLESQYTPSKVLEETINVSPQTKQLLTSDQYILQQIKAIRSIEPLTYAQQYEKFKLFQKKYQNIYKTVLQIDRNKQYYFQIAKISSEAEPVLQRLSQFIDLRFEEAQYSAESAQFIKDIYNQLKVYDQKMINNDYKRRDPYICLNPHNVIVDQFSLKPLLHFEPLLLESLGLSAKPQSLEGRLVFQPTPQGIDYFKTDEEYIQAFERIRRDPLYGCSDLYIAEKQNVSQEQIEKQRQQIEEKKDSILTWRFLLLSHFIRTNEEFGRLKDATSEKEALKHFLKEIKQKKQALRQDASELQQFLGGTKNTEGGATFDGSFEELGQFLLGQKDDSVIEKHGYDRTVRYSALRWMLIREASSMMQLKDTNLFNKLINAKKYTILLLLAGESIFQEAARLIRWERERTGERKHIRELIQSSVKRTKKEKPYDYFKTIFNKIQEYLSRKNTDPGYRYLADSDFFIKKQLQKVNNGIVTLRVHTEKLDDMETRSDPKERQKYKQELTQTQVFIQKNYPSLTTLLKEIIYVEIDQARQNIHRIPPKEQPQASKVLELITRKFLMTTFTFLSLNETNFPLYESLVVPLLNLGEMAGLQEQNALSKSFTKEQLERQSEDLSTVQKLIEYQKIRPKKLSYIRSYQGFKH